MTWEAFDLSSSLSLSGKLVRIRLPDKFGKVVSVERKCKVNSAEYTCIQIGKTIEFNTTQGSFPSEQEFNIQIFDI